MADDSKTSAKSPDIGPARAERHAPPIYAGHWPATSLTILCECSNVMQQYVVAVIEDDPAMRDSVETLVTAFGLYAEVYASGGVFLETAAESEAACLIVDIGLEDMTGIELGRRLKDTGFEFPIIFMTGSDNDALRREAEEVGFVAYLHKPFPAAKLMQAINQAVGGDLLLG